MPDRPWTRSAPTLTPEGEAFVRRTHEQSGAVKHPGRNPRGERNRQAKLAEAAVRDIRRRVAEGGVTKAALAREYGVTWSTIYHVATGRGWRHVERPEPTPRPDPTPAPMPPEPNGGK